MRDEPFTLATAHRVLTHPDTPAAYVDWTEILPLTGGQDRTHLGNLLGWSHRRAQTPLGASRRLFEEALRGDDEDSVDAWMASLAVTTVQDFVDHHIPFLRNVASVQPHDAHAWLAAFLAGSGHRLGFGLPQAPRRPTPPGPESVILEITQSCNFECSMCSSRTGGFLPERTMALPVFGELVRVLGATAKSIRVNGYGETSIVPDLAKYLDCLDEFGFGGLREIITNLSAPAQVYEDLSDRGFVVLVSWDATRRELFEKIRVGADFTAMEARLRLLGSRISHSPERLGLLCTVQEATIDEIIPLAAFAAEVGAGLVIYNMVKEPDGSPWMDARHEEIAQAFADADESARRHGVVLRIPDHIGARPLKLYQTRRSSATHCDRPWRELLVHWDTEATVCNMFHPWSYGLLIPPGPPRDVPSRFARIWSGPNAAAIRRHINRDLAHPYCRSCYFLYA